MNLQISKQTSLPGRQANFPDFYFYKIFQQQERIHSNFFSLKIYSDLEYDTVVF